ncbi:arsenate reductase (glutaredoxin) [Vibrio cholerae]|uniref:Arsenate reductase n=1 Tax=Vibrio cholerae TaxID=666 RepID=A0A5C9SVC1_VIBCL|nr:MULTISPECIES: arsenate reductase (glutaredoxin) [Vibrio]MCO7011381.1 arsenate reductase (glutaredoxin) [Vibrio paracholerae]MCO7018531.1 arsenate reductase (glutaredoxin) [Vibrio paracholerae]MCO7029439.1 arsenate reductase (glutaredoxin) [Vibrio paracholerae]MCO7032333.1 arsenate reductase (glutaredoxin) [Vibrio paracholerae]MCO7045105.1 arsenate reductase (glutaredoxin) [Vibrio paracholerae]
MSVVIYHNPKCSKSRETLALLENQGIAPQVIKYLETSPSVEELKRLYQQLGLNEVRAMMRYKEELYKELNLGDSQLSDDALFAAMAEHPKLIERPIVVCNGQARHGRPPEQVLEIL